MPGSSRDRIHGGKARTEEEAFERLNAELRHAFAATERSYRPLTAAEVIYPNRGRAAVAQPSERAGDMEPAPAP